MTSVFEKSQQGLFSNPNILINTCFRENQRGSSSYSGQGWTFDRLFKNLSGGAGVTTRVANNYTTDPFKAPYSARLSVTTGNDNIGLWFTSEDSRRFRGNPTVTLSFWYKLNGKNLVIQESTISGSGGSTEIGQVISLPATGGWVLFQSTFDVVNWSSDYHLDDYYRIEVKQAGDDSTATGFTLDIADVKLEFGEIATPWMMESESGNALACRRFYFASPTRWFADTVGSPYNALSTIRYAHHFQYPLPTRMRKVPTVTYTLVCGGSNTDVTSAYSNAGLTEDVFKLRNGNASYSTSGDLKCTFTCSAELL